MNPSPPVPERSEFSAVITSLAGYVESGGRFVGRDQRGGRAAGSATTGHTRIGRSTTWPSYRVAIMANGNASASRQSSTSSAWIPR